MNSKVVAMTIKEPVEFQEDDLRGGGGGDRPPQFMLREGKYKRSIAQIQLLGKYTQYDWQNLNTNLIQYMPHNIRNE